MCPLYNIVSDIIAYVVVCVDFLGTHMASLVLFFKIRCDTRCLLMVDCWSWVVLMEELMFIRASVAWNTSISSPKKLLHSFRGQLYVRKVYFKWWWWRFLGKLALGVILQKALTKHQNSWNSIRIKC